MYTSDDVTVLIATKDRINDLRDTLMSFCNLFPKPKYFYIVDNSVDNTSHELIVEFSHTLDLKSFHQPLPGKSRSLNLLLDHLQTRICLFTDDDVRVPSNWVSCMLHSLNTSKCIAVQGEIHIPATYDTKYLSRSERLALIEIRDLEEQFLHSPFLVGANMGIAWHRCQDLRFDENTGPGALGYMDDTLIYLELVERGESVVYTKCSVNHHFPVERLSKPNPLSDGIKHGRSVAYVESIKSVPHRNGAILYLLVRLIRMTWYWVAFRIIPSKYVTELRAHATSFFQCWFLLKYRFCPPHRK
jgi:glycosyltransferase involved in cell wall biosynthesis